MKFDTIAIVGVGLIGGSIGLAVKERRIARRVVGVGRRAASLGQARRWGAIDQGTTKLSQAVADAELTVFCTPVDLIAEQALQAAAHCPAHAILTDSGSTKARIVARLESGLPDGVSFVGSHPLAGSEKRGVQESRADLFDGRVCVVTQTPRTPTAPLDRIEQFWRSLGSRVIRMSPEAHDQALAYTSHLPHLAAAALAIGLPDELHAVVASGFRDTTRIAASDPDLWTAIFLENAGPLLRALASFEFMLREFRIGLEYRDRSRLRGLWARSKTKRRAIGAAEDAETAEQGSRSQRGPTQPAQRRRPANRDNRFDDEPIPFHRLSVRSRKALKRLGVKSLGDLIVWGREGVWCLKNFGEVSLREVEAMLREYGVPPDRWEYDIPADRFFG